MNGLEELHIDFMERLRGMRLDHIPLPKHRLGRAVEAKEGIKMRSLCLGRTTPKG